MCDTEPKIGTLQKVSFILLRNPTIHIPAIQVRSAAALADDVVFENHSSEAKSIQARYYMFQYKFQRKRRAQDVSRCHSVRAFRCLIPVKQYFQIWQKRLALIETLHRDKNRST